MSADAFRFRLEPVLRIRRDLEKERAVELARARKDAAGAREARESLEDLRATGRAQVLKAQSAGGSVGVLRTLGAVVEGLEEEIRRAEDVCRDADDQVSRTLRGFREALLDRQSLDRLRNRRQDEWRAAAGRAEQKIMDEVALSRHGRGGGLHEETI